MNAELRDNILRVLKNWANDVTSETHFIQLYIFGSLLYQGGEQFSEKVSDIDIVAVFSPDLSSASGRVSACTSLLRWLEPLEYNLLRVMHREEAGAPIVSVVAITSAEWRYGIHKDAKPNFFTNNDFYRLDKNQGDNLTVQSEAVFDRQWERVLPAIQETQKVRNLFLRVSANGNRQIRNWDSDTEPLPKSLLRAAAQLRHFVEGKTDNSRYDVNVGYAFLTKLVYSNSDREPTFNELHKWLIARQGGRGLRSDLKPESQLLLWEMLFDVAIKYLADSQGEIIESFEIKWQSAQEVDMAVPAPRPMNQARDNQPQDSQLQFSERTKINPLPSSNNRTARSSSGINPFEYGLPVSPERFFGRFKQFEDIRNRFGSISAQCISIVGFRRNGKTSLLRYVSQRPLEFCTEEQQPLIIYLDLQDGKFHTPTGILEGLKRHISSATGVTPWQNNDEAFEVDDGLRRMARNGCRLIILLDEFECIKHRLDVFKGWGADWRAKISEGLFVLGVASQRTLNEIYKAAGLGPSPFGNIFTETIVGAFEEDEWRNLVRKGFDNSSRDLDITDFDLIDSLAGGLPYYTQMAASLLWQHGEHRKVQTAFAQQTTSRFDELWESLTDGERHALRYAAGMPNLAAPSTSILTRLKLHGLIRPNGHLFSNIFVDYVRGL